jgi:GNAT superfamily N-acetyltransferase
MSATIREYRPSDEPVVVEFALRAVCVHGKVLGAELSGRLHGGEDGWRGYQETAIRRALTDASMHTWVAEVEAIAVGFVTAHLTGDRRIGEVFMLAVDPRQQGQGTGTALTDVATDWLRRSGALVALVETGGDPGHAPARRVYEKAAYTVLPIARYFKAL